jgi:hypothetical protein
VWKYDALTMAAYFLNVRLALHSENVPIAVGRNVVASGFCPTFTKNKRDLIP